MTVDLFASPENSGPTGEIERDRWGRYLIPLPPEDESPEAISEASRGQARAWTRATTFANTLIDDFAITAWKERMVARGLGIRPDLVLLAAATPVSKKKDFSEIVEAAKEAAGASARARLGTAMHSFTEAIDAGEGEGLFVPKEARADLEAYEDKVSEYGLVFEPGSIERVIVVPELDGGKVAGVAGTLDRIATVSEPLVVATPTGEKVVIPPGTRIIDDLKTGRDLGLAWHEIVIQQAIYSRARWIWDYATGTFEPMPEVNQDWALITWLPVGEAKAEIFAVDLNRGWAAAQLCRLVRQYRNEDGLSAPVFVGHPEIPSDPIGSQVPLQPQTAARPEGEDLVKVAQLPDATMTLPGNAICRSVYNPNTETGTSAVCASTDPKHENHTDGKGFVWPVSGMAEGTECRTCGSSALVEPPGRIAHKQGCQHRTRGKFATPYAWEEDQTGDGAGEDAREETRIEEAAEDQDKADYKVFVEGVKEKALSGREQPAKAVDPFSPPVPDPEPEEDPKAVFRTRIAEATSRDDLSSVWKDSAALGLWDKELETAGLARMKELGL